MTQQEAIELAEARKDWYVKRAGSLKGPFTEAEAREIITIDLKVGRTTTKLLRVVEDYAQ